MTCARPWGNATPSEDFPHTSLHASHPALCTSLALCTRHLHSTLHLTSNRVSSSHLISALLISSHLFSHVINVSSSELFSSHPSTDQPFSSPRSSSQLILAVLHARKLLLSERRLLHKKNIGRRKFLHTDTWDTDAFGQKSFSEKLCTTKLAQSTSQYYFVLDSLHTARPSTTLYYKTCTKHVPVLLVLQSLHRALPRTTLHGFLPNTSPMQHSCSHYNAFCSIM